jgi:hypothetical protein
MTSELSHETINRTGPRGTRGECLPSSWRWLRFSPLEFALVGLAMVALLASAVTIDHPPFWGDEVLTIYAVDAPFAAMLHNRIEAGHQPLYFTMLWAWAHVVEPTTTAMRLPSWLFMLATALLVGWVGMLVAGRRVAILAGTLTTISGHMLEFAQLARPYALLGMVLAGLVVAVVGWGRRPSRALWLTVAALTLLSLLVHYSGATAIGCVALFALLRRRPDWPLLAAIAAGAAIWLPWGLWCLSQVSVGERLWWLPPPDTGYLAVSLANVIYDGPGPDRLRTLPMGMGAWSLIGVATAALMVHAAVRLGRDGRLLLLVWAGPILVAAVAMLALQRNLFFAPRYFLASVVAQPVLLAAAMSRPIWPIRRLRPVLAPLIVAIAAGLFTVHLLNPKNNAAWEEIAEYLAPRTSEGDIVAAARSIDAIPLSFYLGDTITAIVAQPRDDAADIAHVLREPPDRLTDTAAKTLWIALNDQQFRNFRRDGIRSPELAHLGPLADVFSDHQAIPFRGGGLLRWTRPPEVTPEGDPRNGPAG